MLMDFVYMVLTITISETDFVCMYSCICDTYVLTIPKKPHITQSNEPVSRELLNKFSANSLWNWIFFLYRKLGMQLFSPCLYVDTLQKVSEKNLYLFTHLYSFAQESQQNP